MRDMKKGPYRYASRLAMLLTVALAGCSQDEHLTVPPPEPGVPMPSPQTPDSALYFVVEGIATKSPALYEHMLPDTLLDGADFHASFDSQDLIEYAQTGSTPPTDWTTTEEKTFIGQYAVLVPVPSYSVVLTPDVSRPDVLGSDETIYYRHYRVSFGSPAHYLGVGLADLHFRRIGVNQAWKMTRWVDHRDTTDFGVRTMGRQRLGPPSP